MSVGSSLGRLLIPVAVASTFALARRYVPAAPSSAISSRRQSAFSRLQWVVGAVVLLVGIVLGFMTYEALVWANRSLALRGGSTTFVLLPSKWIWFFLPLLGAISLAWELTLRLWSRWADSRQVRAYENWSNAKAGFDGRRVLRILAMVIVLPIGIATVLAIPIHTCIDERGISIGHFGTLRTTTHAFSEVSSVTTTDGLRLRDGSLQKGPAIVLDFSDGTRWSSASNRDPERSVNGALLAFIQQKTHLRIKHIEAFPFGAA